MGSEELDKILDSALASYSQEEPRQGLDDRIFNRIRAAGEARRFAWLRWAIAIPVFACILFLAVTFWSKRDSVSTASKRAPAIAKTTPPLQAALGTVQITARRRRMKRLPKREQFPTPTPLTAEERVLLAFIARSPKQAQEVLADAKSRATEPIQIKRIQIEPLQSSGQ